MNENTLNLVSAIINKDATDIETSFNAAMAEKIATRLDDMRANVAQSMFAETEETVMEEELEWISAEEYSNLSEEEQQDYEQLDEISQDLVKKYYNKVSKKAVKKEFPTKDSKKDLPYHWQQDIAHGRLPANRKAGIGKALNRMASGPDYYNRTKAKGGNLK
jgi:hypothetical protein